MGSRHRHSCRPRNAGTSAFKKSKPSTSKGVRRGPSDFDALLGRFSDALSILATATRALSNTQADSEPAGGHSPHARGIELEARSYSH